VVRGVEWCVRRRERLGGFYRREGSVGGGVGQPEGELAVAVANGGARAGVSCDVGGWGRGDVSQRTSAEVREGGGCEREQRSSHDRARSVLVHGSGAWPWSGLWPGLVRAWYGGEREGPGWVLGN
jgi:hypothetical protein